MLQVNNRTPYAVALFSSPDPNGVDTLFVVLKGTFLIAPRLEEAPEQMAIVMADTFRGEPEKTSIARPSEIGLTKPGTDVLLFGHAYGPRGKSAMLVEVSLNVGPIRKRVAVFGDRRWSGTVLPKIVGPEPFSKISLVWERAYGGTETLPGTPSRVDADDRNPVGVGFRSRRSSARIDGTRLPNLENPDQLIGSPSDQPAPAGFGAVSPHWKPRVSFAGTYDAQWQESRAPYLPLDFDERFLQTAPADQQVPGYLKGGEPVEIAGASQSGILRFTIPERRIDVHFHLHSSDETRPANLDSVVILPDENRLTLVWRAALACDKRLLHVRVVEPVVSRAAA
jgi:hypothetical protein